MDTSSEVRGAEEGVWEVETGVGGITTGEGKPRDKELEDRLT